MISKEEIQKIATVKKVSIDIIEKDYVLNWVLAGIHHHTETKDAWIFKGGTCLKKCYFKDYRFSEDLDFTHRGNTDAVSEIAYKNLFIEITKWIYNRAGIEFPPQGIEFEVFKNNRNTISVCGKLSYRGPIQRNVSVVRLPRLKIDLTLDEPLILEPILRKIDHPYSDELKNGKQIFAYSYEELFSEKLRALVERLRPRDLYDIVHLYYEKDKNINLNSLKKTLQKKCDVRSTAFPKIEHIQNHNNRQFVESEWATQLRHQLPSLPLFQDFLSEATKVLEWVNQQ